MEPEKKSNGALVGLIIIIIILIVGGIYIWQSSKDTLESTQPEVITEEDSIILDTLDQDLTDIDTNIDVDLDAVN